MRSRVDAAGMWGPALFFGLYAALALIPVPKALLTAAGGALFGLWAGAGLSLAAALVGAIISFGAGRLLGREAVDRLIRGRLARVDALLADHGLSAVLIVRLVPLVPFIAINYASGLSGVRFRHYVLGSAMGWCLAASRTQPWGPTAPTRGAWPPPAPPWLFSWPADPGGRDGWTRAVRATPPRTALMLDVGCWIGPCPGWPDSLTDPW